VSALNQAEKINELILGILKELHFRVCLLESDEEGQDDGNGTKKLLDKLDKLMSSPAPPVDKAPVVTVGVIW